MPLNSTALHNVRVSKHTAKSIGYFTFKAAAKKRENILYTTRTCVSRVNTLATTRHIHKEALLRETEQDE